MDEKAKELMNLVLDQIKKDCYPAPARVQSASIKIDRRGQIHIDATLKYNRFVFVGESESHK